MIAWSYSDTKLCGLLPELAQDANKYTRGKVSLVARLLALPWCRSPRCVGISAHGGGVYRGHLRAEIGRCRSRGKPLPCRSLMEEPLSQ